MPDVARRSSSFQDLLEPPAMSKSQAKAAVFSQRLSYRSNWTPNDMLCMFMRLAEPKEKVVPHRKLY